MLFLLLNEIQLKFGAFFYRYSIIVFLQFYVFY